MYRTLESCIHHSQRKLSDYFCRIMLDDPSQPFSSTALWAFQDSLWAYPNHFLVHCAGCANPYFLILSITHPTFFLQHCAGHSDPPFLILGTANQIF
ncbi:hypothetical protein NPIL_113351 [Nephila pilipes]|uniref:Uncharacterized protein n=1 Tax=Nephila pilipes TaxID=299642 RepID=A0A8X6QZE6_NEPPI|nr:hypothetical protein NPIL_113351 [Nephila pilipes]